MINKLFSNNRFDVYNNLPGIIEVKTRIIFLLRYFILLQRHIRMATSEFK